MKGGCGGFIGGERVGWVVEVLKDVFFGVGEGLWDAVGYGRSGSCFLRRCLVGRLEVGSLGFLRVVE